MMNYREKTTNSDLLREFLVAANAAGYASGEEKKWVKESDGSTTIHFEQGVFHSHDNFFGGEPYGGRCIVFHENTPYWIMVYYGWVAGGVQTNPVYATLRTALQHMPEEAPFRGPLEYIQGRHTYTNAWTGDLERFAGEEQIIEVGKVIYQAHYMGGLVNQRQGV